MLSTIIPEQYRHISEPQDSTHVIVPRNVDHSPVNRVRLGVSSEFFTHRLFTETFRRAHVKAKAGHV